MKNVWKSLLNTFNGCKHNKIIEFYVYFMRSAENCHLPELYNNPFPHILIKTHYNQASLFLRAAAFE